MNCHSCQNNLPNRFKLMMSIDDRSSDGYKCPHCSYGLVTRIQLYRFRLLSIVTIIVIVLSAKHLIGKHLHNYPLSSDIQLFQVGAFICLVGLATFLIILFRLPINKKTPSLTKNGLFFLGIFLFLLSFIVLMMSALTESPVIATTGGILFIGSLLWVHVFY